MSKERELLKKILATRWLDHELSCEVEAILAQPEQEPINFDLERMKLSVESPVSEVTVDDLMTLEIKEKIAELADKCEVWNIDGDYDESKVDLEKFAKLIIQEYVLQKREFLSNDDAINAESFWAGVEWAEKMHGIGGGDE